MRLRGRERLFYEHLLGRYEPTGNLVEEARDRLLVAQEQLRSLDEGALEGLVSALESFEKNLLEASRTHEKAASHAEAVGRALASGSKTSATEDSYQALHDAVTEALFIVVEIPSVIGNTIDACRAAESSLGACDPSVLSILAPLVDLRSDVDPLLSNAPGALLTPEPDATAPENG